MYGECALVYDAAAVDRELRKFSISLVE